MPDRLRIAAAGGATLRIGSKPGRQVLTVTRQVGGVHGRQGERSTGGGRRLVVRLERAPVVAAAPDAAEPVALAVPVAVADAAEPVAVAFAASAAAASSASAAAAGAGRLMRAGARS